MKLVNCLFVSALLLPIASVNALEQKRFEIPGTNVVPIQDSQSNRQYELYIKLPEDYLESEDVSYPVLYFTDAVWHIELLSASTAFLMEDAILVGISWQTDIDEELKADVGAYASRFRDYTVTESSNPQRQAKYQFGQAEQHLAFIRNDVIKHVENNYRADPDSRSYFGYSAGGSFGAYILLAQPDTFKNYILGSPSLRNAAEIEARVERKHGNMDANVFISYGSLEEELGGHVDNFIASLNSRQDKSLSITQTVIEGSHQTAFPMTGVRAVTWLSNLNKPVKGPYLGQTPPGSTPEVFAPGIVSTEHFSYGGTFAPDMKAFYFLRDIDGSADTQFVVYELVDDRWQLSVLSSRVGQPFISPDGSTMHLGRRYKERTDDGWSELKSLGSPYEETAIMRLTVSAAGTYVYDEIGSEDEGGVLRYSRLINGERQEPQIFGDQINTGKYNAHPFIAPDESYLLWDGRRDEGFGSADIYVSFRQPNGSWGSAINLGSDINTAGWDAAASVTPDGKYLFFHRTNDAGNANIYWVDAQVIEKLRPGSVSR